MHIGVYIIYIYIYIHTHTHISCIVIFVFIKALALSRAPSPLLPLLLSGGPGLSASGRWFSSPGSREPGDWLEMKYTLYIYIYIYIHTHMYTHTHTHTYIHTFHVALRGIASYRIMLYGI